MKKRLYYKFSDYLRERFGCRVYKVGVDAGFSCPNRDGAVSRAGCIYCDNRGFSFNSRLPQRPLTAQIRQGIELGRKRFKAEKFIVYFQAYTNTYAPAEVLREKYAVIRSFNDIVGLAIGTRPDCVSEETLDLLESYSSDYEIWIEYGLQSVHNKTLQHINRGHRYEDFLAAVTKTRKRSGLKICAHVIIGLPGESKEDILTTARELGRLKVDGVKIHPLHIIKGTRLAELFQDGQYQPLALEEYVDLVAASLECLRPQTVIQRITADCPRPFLVAPDWILQKEAVLNRIEEALIKENRFQGIKS